MSDPRSFIHDDDNDTLLFERWEAYVIENHPNPQRIGCPGYAVLKAFVNKPQNLSLAELNDTHITQCRECVLDLVELRRQREELLRRSASPLHFTYWREWRSIAAGATLCILLVVVSVFWRLHTRPPQSAGLDSGIAALKVDLSGDGITRDAEKEAGGSLFALPRKIVQLDLALPYFSPAGQYQVVIARDRNDAPLLVERATAVAHGPHTELHISFDLRRFKPGQYYLGTIKNGESTTYFYPFTLS